MYKPRRVVITGGSSGLGLNFALEFAARNAEIVLLARGAQQLAQARAKIEARVPGARVLTHAVDVSDQEDVRAAARAIGLDGDIDLLINSAGILRENYVDSIDDDIIRTQMDINFFGTVNAVQAFLPQLRRTQGHIVNISSLSGVMGIFGYAGYCASKYAVQGFSEVLRIELKPAGVAVHVVCPGEFDSPMVTSLGGSGRTPENVAHARGLKPTTTQAVVSATLRGIETGKFEIIPGSAARLVRALVRHCPALIHWHGDRTVRRVYVGPIS
ncbi:MAG: short-chain dehydrogenase [Alphaproteobacteria bacterium HGW-Alphaproteobacteria-5]|nr:MAG: short-chain dehydrogenase [Alphaproteobacteria bacterium HGW-Alphaproteobacteria-5]